MQEPLMKAGIASLRVSDHTVHSVSAFNETESQKRKAYRDLAEALPNADACDEIEATIRSIVTTPISTLANRCRSASSPNAMRQRLYAESAASVALPSGKGRTFSALSLL